MHYPVRHKGEWNELRAPSPVQTLRLMVRNRRLYRRAHGAEGVSLDLVKAAGSHLPPSAVILLCILKNAEAYLPSFLRHYRGIGVDRFAFVDDRSTDGSRACLNAANDVDLYESNIGFKAAHAGVVWRDKLIDLYGRRRWYLSVDSDEYLVYPGYETRTISFFIDDLERHGLKRSLAAMIDIYADAALGDVEAPEARDLFPTSVCPLFDGAGYTIAAEKFCMAVRGGPRKRLFGTDMRLTKFPVIFADGKTQFSGGSVHGPLPIQRNFSPVHAVLLHHKFPAGAVDTFREIAASGTHFNGSTFYRSIVDHGGFGERSRLSYEGSMRFEGSQQLVEAGFIKDLRRA